MTIKTPFPYYGSKAKISRAVWRRFGTVRTYVEPFAGSLGVLLGAPQTTWKGNPRREVVNDISGHIVNTWRAIKEAPDELAAYIESSCPVHELDLVARQKYLSDYEGDLVALLKDDPKAYDLEAAAWWLSGISAYIGSGYPGSHASRPHVSSHGQGVHALGRRDRLPYLFRQLAERLRYVKVFCGSWERCLTDQVLEPNLGPAAIFLDPPYTGSSGRSRDLYDSDDHEVGFDVATWCIEHGASKDLRIALCGLEDEYDMPSSWSEMAWESGGNFSTSGRERIWFSPHCVDLTTMGWLEDFM